MQSAHTLIAMQLQLYHQSWKQSQLMQLLNQTRATGNNALYSFLIHHKIAHYIPSLCYALHAKAAPVA
jgi:hypothetical protein